MQTTVFACLFGTILCASAAAAQPVSTGTPIAPGALQLVVSAQLNGPWVTLRCEGPPRAPGLHDLARALSGERDAFALDTGDLLGASAASRLAIRWNADRFARAFVSMGLRALSVGPRDLAAPRDTLVDAARALRGWGIPYVLSNLSCGASQAPLCDAVAAAASPPVVLDSPFGRVAVVSALSPVALAALPGDRAAGLRLGPPAEALTRAARAARAAGARWVVGVFDPAAADPLREALEVAAGIDPAVRPDILLVNDLAGVITQAEAPHSGVRLVATRSREPWVFNVGPTIERFAPILGIAPDALGDTVEALRQSVCETEGAPLPGASLAAPLPSSAFLELALGVLRERTETEVAVVPRGLLQALDGFPLRGAIRPLDLAAALPFDDEPMVATLRGSELRTLARAPQRLNVYGVNIGSDPLRVNGRLLDDAARYRVVTTRHLVEVDAGFEALRGRFQSAGALSLRDLLRQWLERPHAAPLLDAVIDPAQRTRWTFRANLDASLAATQITNRGSYSDAQIARAESTSFRGDLELRADADHPRYLFENQLRLRHGQTRTVDAAGADTGFVENLDLVTLRDGFAWRQWRLSRPRWYQPILYGELYTETELDRPEGAPPPRAYHHLQLRPTLGVRLQLLEKLSVNLGAGIDWETLAPSSTPLGVLVASAQLLQLRLFRVGERWAEAQGTLDVSWRDPFAASDVLLRSTVRLTLPIVDALSLAVGFDLFGRTVNGAPIGVATDATLGLRFNLSRSYQAFAY